MKQFLFFTENKQLNIPHFLSKPVFTEFSSLYSFAFSINNAYAIYDNQLSAWIPKTKNIYDDDYQFLYEYPINYSNINRRLRKIICNNEICHAITENGLVFSWGNDSYHKGTLGLGDNIYQVNTPVLNKYLSKVRIFDISLSEDHCAATDFNNYLYTWGIEEHGELGYFDENEKKYVNQ